MSDDEDVRDKARIRVPLENFGQSPKPKGLKGSKGFTSARQKWRRTQNNFRRKQEFSQYAWMADAGGRKPDVVITDPRGRVRVGIWKNWVNGGQTISYIAQLTFLFWDYKKRRLAAKFTLSVRELFVLSKCCHKAIEWCCKDAGVGYPAQLFEHCQVGFEVHYGPRDADRVVVSSEEEIKRVTELNLGDDEFNPAEFQMPDLIRQFREGANAIGRVQSSGKHKDDESPGVAGPAEEDGGGE